MYPGLEYAHSAHALFTTILVNTSLSVLLHLNAHRLVLCGAVRIEEAKVILVQLGLAAFAELE